MEGQQSIFNYLKPDYQGKTDEITRMSIENRFENQIQLNKCCGILPDQMFKSCRDYFVRCPVCGKTTKLYRHMYEAKQAWNFMEEV